jgi:hypothetical protein
MRYKSRSSCFSENLVQKVESDGGKMEYTSQENRVACGRLSWVTEYVLQ